MELLQGALRLVLVVLVTLAVTTWASYRFPGDVTFLPCFVVERSGRSLGPRIVGFYTGRDNHYFPRPVRSAVNAGIPAVVTLWAALGVWGWRRSLTRWWQRQAPVRAKVPGVSEFEFRLNRKLLDAARVEAVPNLIAAPTAPAGPSARERELEEETVHAAAAALDAGDAGKAITLLVPLAGGRLCNPDLFHYFLVIALCRNNHQDMARARLMALDPERLPQARRYVLACDLDMARLYDLALPIYQGLLAGSPGFRDVAGRIEQVDQIMRGGGTASFENELVRMVDPRYEGVRIFRTGGMGVVFTARDTRSGQEVAVKMLSPFLRSQPEAKRRFLREARVLAELDHPNIVKTYAVHTEPCPHYSMELLHEKSLAELIEAEAPLPLDRVESVVTQILDGLGYCHGRRIIHRDIKPQNIVIPVQKPVKILDFGLVKAAHATHMTVEGTVLGTLAYMPPEVLRGRPADTRSDLYSVAVVLYQMTTGVLPFPPGEQMEVAIVTGSYPAAARLRPDLPPRFDEVIARGLNREPPLRYGTAPEFCQALRAAALSA